jgi:hypothetical protein
VLYGIFGAIRAECFPTVTGASFHGGNTGSNPVGDTTCLSSTGFLIHGAEGALGKIEGETLSERCLLPDVGDQEYDDHARGAVPADSFYLCRRSDGTARGFWNVINRGMAS